MNKTVDTTTNTLPNVYPRNDFTNFWSTFLWIWFIRIHRQHVITCTNDHPICRPQCVNGRHFADDIFKYIFLNENGWIPIKISLKFVPKGRINNIPALVQIMAWRRTGDKPLSEPMMVSLPTHIYVTRPQWVNPLCPQTKFWSCLELYWKWSDSRHTSASFGKLGQFSVTQVCQARSRWVYTTFKTVSSLSEISQSKVDAISFES